MLLILFSQKSFHCCCCCYDSDLFTDGLELRNIIRPQNVLVFAKPPCSCIFRTWLDCISQLPIILNGKEHTTGYGRGLKKGKMQESFQFTFFLKRLSFQRLGLQVMPSQSPLLFSMCFMSNFSWRKDWIFSRTFLLFDNNKDFPIP